MIRTLSENVVVPIAGLVITYVLCYELISMVTEKNNMHDIDTFMFFKRDVWLINTVPYSGGHFAAYPPKLAETCILAGCPKGGVVIAPFLGSGTTAAVAKSLDRHYIGIELNIEYCALARARIGGVKP